MTDNLPREDQADSLSPCLPVSLSPCLRVFLIGPRGSGKTTVARHLAARLGWNHLDADAELERRLGRTIRQLFAEDGEAAFRDQEATLLAELCRLEQHVLATGGGVVLRPENRARMKTAGRVVWLTAAPETLALRLTQDATTSERRPALSAAASATSLDEIVTILRAREALYRVCADHSVSTEGRTPEQVADAVLAELGAVGTA